MPKPSQAAAALAALLLAAQPCAAADDLRDTNDAGARRTAPFAGVGLSLPLSRSAKAKPSARLQFTPARPAGGTFARPAAAGLELGLARTGKPELYLGGRPADDLGRRLNVGGSTTTVLVVVGGLVLLVLLANAVADAQPTPGPRDGAFD